MDINGTLESLNLMLQFAKWYMIGSAVLIVVVAWFALCIHSRLVEVQQEVKYLKNVLKGEEHGERIE